MTVLRDIHHHRLAPAEQEVAGAGARCHCHAQVRIVCHEDQHQQVTDHHLDDVQQSLKEVGGA